LVSIPQSAQMLGRGVSTIYDLLARGEIEARRSDGRTLVTYDSLVAYKDRLPRATFAAPRDKRPQRMREAEAAKLEAEYPAKVASPRKRKPQHLREHEETHP
jgi:hypothetical protein